MAEYHVSTIDELFTLLKDFTDLDKTIFIDNDIDFNNTDYWNRDADFCNISYSSSTAYNITIDGQNHSLTNIYLYPNRNFLSGHSSTTYDALRITIKNTKFEVMCNSSNFMRYIYRLTFDNCQFNMKLYGVGGGRRLFNLYISNSTPRPIFKASNTLFNIYINSYKSDYDYVNSSGMIAYVYSTGSNSVITIDSCVIKIQNRTDLNFKNMFYCGGHSSYGGGTTVRNSAIFFNDIGQTKPTYNTSSSGNKQTSIFYYESSSNVPYTKYINSYFASFGTPSNKPVIVLGYTNGGTNTTSCFFDSDKLQVGYWYSSGSVYWAAATKAYGCASLTTEQCKDPDALSEAGFVFAEETN